MNRTVLRCKFDQVPYLFDPTAPLPGVCLACREEMFSGIRDELREFDELPDDSPSNC